MLGSFGETPEVDRLKSVFGFVLSGGDTWLGSFGETPRRERLGSFGETPEERVVGFVWRNAGGRLGSFGETPERGWLRFGETAVND